MRSLSAKGCVIASIPRYKLDSVKGLETDRQSAQTTSTGGRGLCQILLHCAGELLSHPFGDTVDPILKTAREAQLVQTARIVLSEATQRVRWEYPKGRVDLSLVASLR